MGSRMLSDDVARRLVEAGVIDGPLKSVAAVRMELTPGEPAQITVWRWITDDAANVIAEALTGAEVAEYAVRKDASDG